MSMTGNTILITGGGSGIGRGLAEALHALGNKVIIAGRRQAALDDVTKASPGMASLTLDVEKPAAIQDFARHMERDFPALNMLINNAGIMRPENLLAQPVDLAEAEAIITTNLLGPIRLTAALLPLLRRQAAATIVNVSSGLAFVPLSATPTYCATKAAIHSYTQSLRYQLKDTPVKVLEIIPPYVATELMNGADDPRAMPLDDFIKETMTILQRQPQPEEICVERVGSLRFAERKDAFDQTFKGLNEAMAAKT